MDPVVQITFRNMKPSSALESDILRRAAALKRRSHRLASCRVVVEAPSSHHRKGGSFHVRVEMHLMHGPALTLGPRDDTHAHSDVYIAIRDAFIAAGQRLTDGTRDRGGVARRLQRARRRVSELRLGTTAPQGGTP